MRESITVETTVHVPISEVWQYFTHPEHVVHWNFASADWCSPSADNDLRIGGKFKYRMEARDGSTGFDFGGTYTGVEMEKRLDYVMNGEDARKVSIQFSSEGDRCRVRETFEAESKNSLEMQRNGWQAILDNFKKYAEAQ